MAANAYRASLKTSDRSAAIAKAHALIADYQRQFQELRESIRAPRPTSVTPGLAKYIEQEVRRLILQAEENVTVYSDNKEQRGLARAAFIRARQQSLEAMRGGDLEIAQRYAERVTGNLGITVDWAKPEARRHLIQIGRVVVASWLDLDRRAAGEPIETPEAPEAPQEVAKPAEPAQEAQEQPKTLRDVVPAWERRTNAKPDAKKRTKRALELFEQAVGVLPLSSLTKAVGARFVDFLLDTEARGFIAKTAHSYASAINALVNIAVKVDWMDLNPFDLSFDKTVGSEKRTPWTDDQLRTLFSHRLFSDQMETIPSWHNVTPDDARAALLILMHTGARIGEIAQLRREDFQVRGGIKTFHVTAEAGTVKTKESERFVSLASHLLADPWFSQWHQGVTGGAGPAFPSLHGRATKTPGDILIQWFAKFREDAGLPKGALNGSHKFRHWIRSTLAGLGVLATTADAITGHESKGSSGTTVYTHTASPRTILEALDLIEWPKVVATP